MRAKETNFPLRFRRSAPENKLKRGDNVAPRLRKVGLVGVVLCDVWYVGFGCFGVVVGWVFFVFEGGWGCVVWWVWGVVWFVVVGGFFCWGWVGLLGCWGVVGGFGFFLIGFV